MAQGKPGQSEPQLRLLGDCSSVCATNLPSKLHWRKTNKLCIGFARERTPSPSLSTLDSLASGHRSVEVPLGVSSWVRFDNKESSMSTTTQRLISELGRGSHLRVHERHLYTRTCMQLVEEHQRLCSTHCQKSSRFPTSIGQIC